MSNIKYGRGYVYRMEFHIVICFKYREKLLDKYDIYDDLKDSFISSSQKHNVDIIEINYDKDHIHMLVSTKPQIEFRKYIQSLKGKSSKDVFDKYPHIKKDVFYNKGHLWNPTYFISTVSETTSDEIKEYIKNQRIDGKRTFN